MSERTAYESEACINKSRLPTVILKDTSGSMAGEPICEENRAVNKFFEQGHRNTKTGSRTDVCIIDFNDDAKVVMDWTVMKDANPELNSYAGGCTNIDAAVSLGLKKIDEKCKEYDESDTPHGAPLIVLVTDGLNTSPIDNSVRLVHERLAKTDKNGLKTFIFMPIFVDSPEMDTGTRDEAIKSLSRYTGSVFIANSGQYDEIFNFINASIKAIYDSGGTKAVKVPLSETGLKVVTLN